MANEIKVVFDIDQTDLWFILFKNDSGTMKVLDVTAAPDEWDTPWADGDIDRYDIALTELGGGAYFGNMPSLSGWDDADYPWVAYQGAKDNTSIPIAYGSVSVRGEVVVTDSTAALMDLNLDHLMKTAVSNRDTIPEVVDDTVLANIMTKTDGDTSDFDHATMSLEALNTDTDAILLDTGTTINTVINSGTVTTNAVANTFVISAGSTVNNHYNGHLITIYDDSTSTYQTRVISDYAGHIKQVILRNDLTFTTEGTVDTFRIWANTFADPAIAGGSANTYIVTDDGTSEGEKIPDVHVWVTQDAGGNTILASGTTDSDGEVVFYLDAGNTYYIWKSKSGYTFADQPETVTAT